MTRERRRDTLRRLAADNSRWPTALIEIPARDRPAVPSGWLPAIAVYRSREFMVQVFEEGPYLRLSINRTSVDEHTLRWREDITWEQLQRLKAEAGFADREAVEIYPPAGHEVNVANMRHLWVLPEPLPFSWKRP